MIKVAGFLTDTVIHPEHPRAIALQEMVDNVAKPINGALRSLSMLEPGVAVLDIEGEEAEKHISAELSKLDGVTVSHISPFEMHLQKNRAAQAKVNKMRVKKQKKGESTAK